MKTGNIIMGILAFVVLFAGMASATENLVLSTDKANYEAGEEIIITFTNEGDCVDTVPAFWIEDEGGEFIYAPDKLMFVKPLAPGESDITLWDQTDGSGELVAPGYYTIKTSDGDTEDIRVKSSILRDDKVVKPLPGKKLFKLF